MHHQSLWKGITIFSFALGIGTFTGDYFKAKDNPEKLQTVQQKNCIFADKNLKYQTLSLKEEMHSVERIDKPNLIPVPKGIKVEKQTEAEKSPIKKVGEIDTTLPKTNNNFDVKDKEQYSTLLHKELCYESDGRK